jgi:hypothetical protein
VCSSDLFQGGKNMAGFCVQCGTPLIAGAKFCEGCGAAASGTGAAPSPAPPSPARVFAAPATPAPVAAPVSQGSNTAVKIILIVVAVFVFLSLLAAGSCFYIAYRVKKRAHEFSRQMQLGTDATPYTGSKEPCAMLTASEASAILGEPVQSAEPSGDRACEYHYGANGGRILNIEYTWQGGAMTMGFTRTAMKGAVAGMNTFQSAEGIGDEAYVLPMGSGLLMRKGDVLVHFDMRVNGVSVEAAEKMARTIAGRL